MPEIQSDLAIVIPAFNESECVKHTFEEIKTVFNQSGIQPHFILVDDGSSDSTPTQLQKIAAENPERVSLITHKENRGLGAAIKTGFMAAQTPWVGWMPSDGQIAPESLLKLYKKREGFDVVTGRVAAANRLKADNLFRLLLSRGSRAVMKTLHPFMPSFNGIIILNKSSLDLRPLICTTGFVNMEILDRLRRKKAGNVNRFEEEIILRPRLVGHSKVTNSRTISLTFWELVKLRFVYLTGK